MKNNSGEYKKEVIEVISKIAKDKSLLSAFIEDILTLREFDNIGVRWQIIKKLAKNQTHHTIAGELGLGVSTVTRGSREMRDKNGGFRRVLKFLKLK